MESALPRAVATLGLGTPTPFWEAPDPKVPEARTARKRGRAQPSCSLPGLGMPGLFHPGGSGHVTELWPMGFEHAWPGPASTSPVEPRPLPPL